MFDFDITVPELEVGDADDLHGVADQLRHLHAAPLHPAVDEQTRGEGPPMTLKALFINFATFLCFCYYHRKGSL